MTDPAADIEAIKALKARYFRTLDRQDWDAYRDVFCDDVEIDTTDDAGPGTETSGVDAYLSMLRPFMDGARSVHHGHMPEIELTGAVTARGVWAMEDHVWFAEATGLGKLWGTGWYEEEYRRVDGRWRIARMVLRRQHVELGGVQSFPPPASG